MAIRMTGLTSGLDTESIVAALVSAQKMKGTKVQNKLTKSEWSEEIWKGLNTKLYSFYTKELTKFKTQGNYITKKATSSKESAVTATASNSAANGSHSLEIRSLASSQNVTGSKIDATSTVKSLTDLGMTAGTVIKVSTVDGKKSAQLEVTGSTTIADFVSTCKSIGLNANFDTKQQRIFISSASSGADQGFSITTGRSTRADADTEIKNLISNATGTDDAIYDNYVSAADTIKAKLKSTVEASSDQSDNMVNAAMDILNCVRGYYRDGVKKDKLDKYGITTDEYQAFEDAFNAAKAVDYIDPNDSQSTETLNDIMSDYLSDVSNVSKLKQTFDTYAASTDKILFKSELSSAYDTLKSLSSEQFAELKTLAMNGTTTEEDIEAAGLTQEQYDNYKLLIQHVDQTVFDEQMEIYAKNEVVDATPLPDGSSQLTVLGLAEIDAEGKTEKDNISGTDLSIKWANDAVIKLDGAELTGASNTFSVNGLTLNLTATTLDKTTGEYEEIQLNVTNDTDTAYKMVKEFVTKYNELLEEMNKLYNADSARGYDPLTDEQKEAMTDDEIEKWETKIKDSLLRRDDTLNGIITVMRSSLQTTTEVDGKKYSLYSFGICTSSDYTEKGKLHIYGDEDDETYSTKTNKLKEALENNPEAVMKTLAEAGQSLYDAMTKKMAKTSLSSALTFYNDKKMDDDQKAYKKQISALEDKLNDLEDRYYKQFTAMEKAMTKMQNSASVFGTYYGNNS
jgi:flagellar hook-associated protein 2